ncbi:MAG: DUF2612 domain-containing protein [Alphaproteobacteria bacterium]
MVDFSSDYLNVLQRQYGETNIADLMKQKGVVLQKHLGNISSDFIRDFLNFDTCISSALDFFWGKMFKVSRVFLDNKGNKFSLKDEQFREIIKIRSFGTTWDGDAVSMNIFLSNIFGHRGSCYLIDKQNMTQIFIFNFELEDWERFLFSEKDIFPRPAGVKSMIKEVKKTDWFGFEESGFEPFDQKPFYE